jgi:hypothetical protein
MKAPAIRAMELTGHAKRGKPRAGFPSFPTALGNRCAIPTFPQPRRRPRGNWKSETRIPTSLPPLVVFLQNLKRRIPRTPTPPSFRLILRLENAQNLNTGQTPGGADQSRSVTAMTTEWRKQGTGWVIRKHIGYGHIAASHAKAFDEFYREHFNPYLTFHRSCDVPEVVTGAKGKQKRVYCWYGTPWEILRQLPEVAGTPGSDLTMDHLEGIAATKSDTEAAASECRKPRESYWPVRVTNERNERKGGRWK